MSSSPDDPKAGDYLKGQEAAQRFDSTMRRIMKVSKDELTKREAAYQKHRKVKRRTPK